MTELKSCPFCGGEAELENNGIFARVLCPHCEIHQTDYFPECEKEAIAAWNTRVVDSPVWTEEEIEEINNEAAELHNSLHSSNVRQNEVTK